MSLHFDISATDVNISSTFDAIKKNVVSTKAVFERLGEFDMSTVKDKIISLGQVIRDNKEAIAAQIEILKDLETRAAEAFNKSDFSAFESLSESIAKQRQEINETINSTQEYAAVLQTVRQSAGMDGNIAESVSIPKFFTTEEDYLYAENLRQKIEELQIQISQLDSGDDRLAPLRNQLSETTAELSAADMEAARTASALGEKLGGQAAEVSTTLYQLNAAVRSQDAALLELRTRLNEAAAELENLSKTSSDSDAIDRAKTNYELLAKSVNDAEQKLLSLKAAQQDASINMQQVTAEVETHDSVLVKMLGGYENYSSIISKLPGPIQGVITSITGMTGAAKAFIATPLGLIIGAIVIALQSLKAWFDSSKEGQIAFAEISGYVTGVLDQLKEILIAVGRTLFKVFSDPKKSLIEFGNAIQKNVMNRFKALGDIVSNFGLLMKAVFSGNVDSIKEKIKDLSNSFLQVGTGVEDVIGKVSNATQKAGTAITETHKKAMKRAEISKAEKMLEIGDSKTAVANAKREERMSALRKDMYSQDAKTRKKAIDEYKKLSEEQMKVDMAQLDRRIALQKQKMFLTTNSIEDENELRSLEEQKIRKRSAHNQRVAMLARRENGIGSLNRRADSQENSQIALQNKLNSSDKKIQELLKKQADERLKSQQEYEFTLWQNRIDLMDDGEQKVLEQMRLNNKKEQIALENERQNAIKAETERQKTVFEAEQNAQAARNKKYVKKNFDSESDIDLAAINEINDRYDKLYIDLKAKQQKAEQDRLNSAKESMNAYLQNFGDYQQKRQAIQEEYEAKIAKAQNKGERMMLIAQRNQSLANLDFNEWQDNGGMALAFSDVSKLSGDTIKDLISKMEEYRDKVIATFDPDKIQKFEKALNNLRQADIDLQFNFGSNSDIIKSLKERLSLIKQINDEEANATALENQKSVLEQQISELTAKTMEVSVETAAVDPDGKVSQSNGASEEDIKRIEELRVQIKQVSDLLAKSANNSQQLSSQLKQMQKFKFADVQKFSKGLLNAARNAASFAEIFDDDIADAISSGIDKVEGLIDVFETVSSNIEALANATKNAVNSTVDASEQLVEAAGDGMKESASITTQSLSTIEKASAILAIIGAAIQLATMVASLFNSDKKHEKNIERLQEKIDDLQRSYDKLGRSIENSYSVDSAEMIEQQNALLLRQKGLIRQQMEEEEQKKKTDKDRLRDLEDKLIDIDNQIEDNKRAAKEAIIGEDIKSAINEFADAYISAWEDGTDAAAKSMSTVKNIITSALNELLKKNLQPKLEEFYKKIAEYADGGFTETELRELDLLKQEIDKLAAEEEEEYKKILDRYKDLDELKEELTDISFDSVRDNFKSQLLDMETDVTDFTESFTDMLRNAVIEGLMSSKYDKMLKEWYDEFAKAMENRSLSDEERERLRQQYYAIIEQGVTDRDALNEIIGGNSYSQEASSGGWETMGQDTADELNGRFTALTELTVIGNRYRQEGNHINQEILDCIKSVIATANNDNSSDNTLLDIKDMMFLQTGYLEDIAKYSKFLNSIDNRIDELNRMIYTKL